MGEDTFHHSSLRYQGNSLSFTRVAFLLSEFSFEGQSGTLYPYAGKTLYYEAHKHAPLLTLDTDFPEDIIALHFSLGLPPQLNLADPNKFPAQHPLNPNLNNLHWSQETGYIFLALEGQKRLPKTEDQTVNLRGYSLHYANQHNLLPLRLTLPSPAKNLPYLELTLDLSQALHEINFSTLGYTTHSQKGDPLAQQLRQNLTSSFSLRSLTQKAPPAPKKTKPPLYLPKEPVNLAGYPLKIGKNLPIPALPTDNPLLKTRVELGKTLFHDPRLSQSEWHACSSCHKIDAAYAQNSALSRGFDGTEGRRNAMPLFNLAWKSEFFWEGRSPSLRNQVLQPITDPHELGQSLPHLITTLEQTEHYPGHFARAFDSPEITAEKISLALEAFLLTLTSYDSKFDQAAQGKAQLTAQEQRGFELFMTEYEPRLGSYGADCFHCHGGALFSDYQYHNNGLGDLLDLGRYDATSLDSDKGKFQTPSLRNIALTAPYMHDGRFDTLEEVINHYASPMSSPSELSPLDANLSKHGRAGIPLSKDDQAALVAFLKTLTDPQFGKSK